MTLKARLVENKELAERVANAAATIEDVLSDQEFLQVLREKHYQKLIESKDILTAYSATGIPKVVLI